MFTQPPSDSGLGARPKTKFVPLFSEEGIAKTVAKLPGKLPYAIRCNFIISPFLNYEFKYVGFYVILFVIFLGKVVMVIDTDVLYEILDLI